MIKNLNETPALRSTAGMPQPSRRFGLIAILLGVGLLATALTRQPVTARSTHGTAPSRTAAAAAKEFRPKVVNSYPHDREAFLQGLVWAGGEIYESTGLLGESTLRRVDMASGRVLQSVSLPSDVFGEGLAAVGDRLVQLTWQSRRGFVYDRATFRLLREFAYDTEGWGLTYDGAHLILSDGTDTLTFLDPQTFEPIRKLVVTWDGAPVRNLNELEFIEGQVWANVWHTDSIVRIDPSSGKVASFVDLTGLLPSDVQRGGEDVLNGIAYDAENQRIFVSGKRWPTVFEITVKKKKKKK